MKNQNPFWFSLINAWLKKGRYGLTLPFLVGAQAQISGKTTANRRDVESLLDDIISNPVNGHIVHIKWCYNIHSPVFAFYDENSPYRLFNSPIEIISQTTGRPSLKIDNNLATELGVTEKYEDILRTLVDKSIEHIEKGNFSKDWTEEGLTYGPFSEESINFIEETLTQ